MIRLCVCTKYCLVITEHCHLYLDIKMFFLKYIVNYFRLDVTF